MRKLISGSWMAAALALSVAGCAGQGGINVPAAPIDVADKTTLDETGARGVELAYKAFRSAMEIAVDYGVITGAAATRVADLDQRAYALTRAARAAYLAGNARSYQDAVDAALEGIAAATAAVKG